MFQSRGVDKTCRPEHTESLYSTHMKLVSSSVALLPMPQLPRLGKGEIEGDLRRQEMLRTRSRPRGVRVEDATKVLEKSDYHADNNFRCATLAKMSHGRELISC